MNQRWLPHPYGSGVYAFRGERRTTRGSIVTMADHVRLEATIVGRKTEYFVTLFGRSSRLRLCDFEGEWLKLRTFEEATHEGP